MRRIRFIARKEIYHILRDPRSLAIALAMPIMMTFLYGYAINMDIENLTLAVIDRDNTEHSRALTEDFYASPYFSPPKTITDLTDPRQVFRNGQAHAILVIRPGFSRAVTNREEFTLGLLVDGSDNNIASAVRGYVNGLIMGFQQDLLPPGAEVPGIRLRPRVLYNPDLKSSHFFVPALVALIMLMISALLTSITLAREKETGTMEQLLTAPVRPAEVLIGKLIPYIGLAFLDGILVLVFALLVFGVPFVGSETLLLGFGLIYVATSLSIGILISSLVRTQQVAMMFTVIATMLPSVMLSGFIFAIKNMPTLIQPLSQIIPATYFVTIIRGIMLKGAGLTILLPQAGALVLLMVVMMGLAARFFRTRVA